MEMDQQLIKLDKLGMLWTQIEVVILQDKNLVLGLNVKLKEF